MLVGSVGAGVAGGVMGSGLIGLIGIISTAADAVAGMTTVKHKKSSIIKMTSITTSAKVLKTSDSTQPSTLTSQYHLRRESGRKLR